MPSKLSLENIYPMKHRLHIFSFVLAVVLLLPLPVRAITSSYYSSLEGKSAKNLFDAIHTVSKTGYSGLSYAQLWTAYCAIDINSSGKVWDMYSNTTSYTCGGSAQGANYNKEGDSYNREHSIPKSWFGGSTSSGTPGTDLFHVVPTDGYVNNMRSALAFGEVSSATYTSNSGCKKGTAKSITISNTILATSGSSTQSCSATVFEPMDEYKGDFARGYFGSMVMWANGDYQKFTTDEGATMFNTAYDAAHYYGLTAYGVALLMKWHREDPVSQKEIDRNNGIQSQQGNRNPFIDYPCLAEYLWGNKTGETFNLSGVVGSFESGFTPGVSDGCACSTDPTLTVNTTSLTVDPVAVNGTSTKTFTITGANLTGNITITKTSGSGFFTVSPSPITSGYNGSNTITITYHPTSTGDHTATFTIASNGATSKTVTVSGSCTTVYTATWMADGSQYHQNTAASGSAPSVPEAPDDCSSSRVFMGWTDNENYSGSGSGLFTDEAPTMTTDKTFYAVYADKETSSGGSPVVTTVFSTTSLGSTNTVTTGYTVSATASAKSGYYQDGSGTSGVTIYNTTTPMFTSTPSAILLTVSIGAGSGGLDFSDYVYATLVNGSGTAIGTAVQITNHVTTSTGDSYTVSIPTTGITSANGIYLYHTKESGQNIRYYSASLSITTGGSTTTYSNYSTQCTASSCTLSNIILNTSSVQKSFAVGDAFNYTGLIVTANYSDCVSKTVTPTSVSSPDMSTTGNKTVTVSYTESGTTKTATYTITIETAPEYTVTFMNMGGTHATRTGTAGSAISAVSEPAACTGYTFEGWSTNTYTTDNTDSPVIDYTGLVPAGGATYYAVYSKTEGSGSSAATAGTTLWSEDFSGYSANDVPSGSIDNDHTGTTVYSGTLTYAVANGGGTTKIYAENSAGGTSPELLIAKSNGSFSITNLPTGSAATMTLSFNSNKTSYINKLSVTSGTSGISIGSLSYSGSVVSCTITNSGSVETFDLTIAYKDSYNSREDNFLLTVATAGSGGSTTYHTTAPNCCTATITATSNDENMGTVGVTLP